MSRFVILPLLLFLIVPFQVVNAQNCELIIAGNDSTQFDSPMLTVDKSCVEVTLTLNHEGLGLPSIMGHNWVLTTAADFQAVANDAMNAGQENHFVPVNDPRILASTKIIGGGETTTINVSLAGLEAGQEYVYFCSFPGHWNLMKGVFRILE